MTSNDSDVELMIIDDVIDPLDLQERRMTTISDLPVEILPLIFEHLDLLDLPNCILVSKLWKFYIDRIKIRELIVYDSNCSPEIRESYCWNGWQQKMWSFDRKLWNLRNCIEPIYPLYIFPFELDNVRRLTLDIIRSESEFEIIQLFPKVQHLELICLAEGSGRGFRLNSPDLKKLRISNIKQTHLTVNSKIESLSCYSIDTIDFAHPLNIKFLELVDWRCVDKLSKFKNVEHCNFVYSISWLYYAGINVLTMYQNLKIIQCDSIIVHDQKYDIIHQIHWDEAIDDLIERTKAIEKKQKIKIYIQGTEYISSNQKVSLKV